jgi:hypothetical protein
MVAGVGDMVGVAVPGSAVDVASPRGSAGLTSMDSAELIAGTRNKIGRILPRPMVDVASTCGPAG